MNWTLEKDDFVKKNYNKGNLNLDEIAKYLGVSRPILVKRASELNLIKSRSKLTLEDKEFILNNYKDTSYNKLAEMFKVDPKTIREFLYKQGKKNPRAIYSQARKWTKEEEEFLTSNWKNFSLNELAEKTGRTLKSIEGKAVRMGLGEKGRPKSLASDNEIIFSNILNDMGIIYEREYILDEYSYDFYLIEYDVLVEIQGSYFHKGNSNKKRLRDTLALDEKKHKYAIKKDFVFIELWDHQIKQKRECKQFLISVLPPNLVNCGEWFKN